MPADLTAGKMQLVLRALSGEAGLRPLHKVRLTDCSLQELCLVVLKDDLQQAGSSLRARGSRQLTKVWEQSQSCNMI